MTERYEDYGGQPHQKQPLPKQAKKPFCARACNDEHTRADGSLCAAGWTLDPVTLRPVMPCLDRGKPA